jgi:hypothetical protein
LGHRKFGIFLWFTFFLSSQISGEPVNHGSQITQAPKSGLDLRQVQNDRF